MNSRVCIDKADNGWVVTYNSYGSMRTEIYTDEEELLTQVYMIVGLKWDVGDTVKIIKEQP